MKHQKTKQWMRLIKMAGCAILFSAATLSHQVRAAEPADWMSGEFGVGWTISFHNPNIVNWDVSTTVNQVKSIPGVKYVLFNLSQGAFGDRYLAPHSVLSSITPGSTPNSGRDLFKELAEGFKAEGIKVIAYMACQGPAMLKHGAEYAYDKKFINGQWTSQAMNNWADHVRGIYGNTSEFTYKRAYADIIFKEYAKRYRTLVDGWWLDNGSDTHDAQRLYNIAKTYNPNTVVASNGNKTFMAYRNGHPTPMAVASPSNNVNETKLLIPIEGTPDGYFTENDGKKTLGHMYMPIQRTWNTGDLVFTASKGANWKGRCLNAGGAWTWSVGTQDHLSRLKLDAVVLLKEIVARLPKPSTTKLVQIRKRNALNFCLNGGGTAPYDGQNVRLWGYIADHPAMTWEEIDRGDGYYSYQKKGTNYSLDGGNGGINAQNVYLWSTSANNYNQHWKKVNKGGGYVQLKKRNAAFAVAGGNGGANAQNVKLFSASSGNWNLQWKIEYR